MVVGSFGWDQLRFRNCAFISGLDDGMQIPASQSRIEYGYCYFLNSAWGGFGVSLNATLKPTLLLMFFSGVGMTADLRLLKQGGEPGADEVTSIAVARILGVSLRTLRQWHESGTGPAAVVSPETGLRVYKLSDVVAWRDANS